MRSVSSTPGQYDARARPEVGDARTARVAMVILEDFPGVENRLRRQVQSLRAAGHELRIFAARGPSRSERWQGVPVERSLVRRVKAGTVARRLLEYNAFLLSATGWLLRQALRWKPDVVQIANPPDWLVLSTLPARLSRQARVVLDLHEPMPELMQAKGGGACLVGALYALQRVSMRVADVVLVPTHPMADALRLRHSREVVVIPNGVDIDAFLPSDRRPCSAGELRIGYVGTLAERFGVEVLLDALGVLRERNVPASLDLYGDGDARVHLEERTRALQLGDRVTFHGLVPADAIPAAIASLDVGTVPYRDSAFMRLAYSTKAFEYAAVGLPIVVSDLPSLRRQLGEGRAVFVPAGTPSDWADAFERLATDERHAASLAGAARRAAVEEFSWRRFESTYVEAVIGHTLGEDVSAAGPPADGENAHWC